PLGKRDLPRRLSLLAPRRQPIIPRGYQSIAENHSHGTHMAPRNTWRRLLTLLGALVCLALLAGPAAAAQIRCPRHPHSHNAQIVFSYQGALWLVNEDGSHPQRMTVHRAVDNHPKFSPDGKWIAFSSARYGNADVFVMPAAGGAPRRLTYHSAADTVVGW